MDLKTYNHIRSGGAGFIEMSRGLIAVWGKEAVQFLDGMITNDMKTLEGGQQMLAAFPNAQGRLIAVVRILRNRDRFLIETEESTREKVYQNLFRFTFAGDFFVEDVSNNYAYFETFGFVDYRSYEGALVAFCGQSGSLGCFLKKEEHPNFSNSLKSLGAVAVDPETYETLRIESGTPKDGVDMDETTIVPELGLDGMISYTKGCYIGQEIIARIHFRGHVAKQLTGLLSEPGAVATGFSPGTELKAPDGKSAGRITSVTYSPKLGKQIALGYVRYKFRESGTQLITGDGSHAEVAQLPFV